MDFWRDGGLEERTLGKGKVMEQTLRQIAAEHGGPATEIRGRGMALGIALGEPGLARAICGQAFERGLILETSAGRDEVVKLMPALTVPDDDLAEGLDILRDAVRAAVATA